MAMCSFADRIALLTLLFIPCDRVRLVRRMVRLTFIGFMPGTADNRLRLVEVNLVELTPRNQLKGASNGTYIGRSKQDGSGSNIKGK